MIRLAQVSLCKIDAADADRFRVAAILLARMRARGFGEHQPGVSKYNDSQPRVPAGNGRASGQWNSGSAESRNLPGPLIEGRSAALLYRPQRARSAKPITIVPDLPKDAIVVRTPDGEEIANADTPTGRLMAPPQANYQEIYAAGERIADLSLSDQYDQAGTALRQFGTYDFQRDRATNSFFRAYTPAANYAVGVYMAGAGYNLANTHITTEAYALEHSSNALTYNDRKWVTRGWQDAKSRYWK